MSAACRAGERRARGVSSRPSALSRLLKPDEACEAPCPLAQDPTSPRGRQRCDCTHGFPCGIVALGPRAQRPRPIPPGGAVETASLKRRASRGPPMRRHHTTEVVQATDTRTFRDRLPWRVSSLMRRHVRVSCLLARWLMEWSSATLVSAVHPPPPQKYVPRPDDPRKTRSARCTPSPPTHALACSFGFDSFGSFGDTHMPAPYNPSQVPEAPPACPPHTHVSVHPKPRPTPSPPPGLPLPRPLRKAKRRRDGRQRRGMPLRLAIYFLLASHTMHTRTVAPFPPLDASIYNPT